MNRTRVETVETCGVSNKSKLQRLNQSWSVHTFISCHKLPLLQTFDGKLEYFGAESEHSEELL